MILPIVINGEPNIAGNQITAHVMTSAHGRKNAWTGLVAEAIEAEQNGNVGIFYIDKAKASKVFTKLAQANPKLARVGLIYAKDTQSNGTLHSIADEGSPVKGGGFVSQTATKPGRSKNRLAREAFHFGGTERQLLRSAKGTLHSVSDFGSPVKGVGAQTDSVKSRTLAAY